MVDYIIRSKKSRISVRSACTRESQDRLTDWFHGSIDWSTDRYLI